MNQPTAPQSSRKKTILSLLVLLALTGVIVLIFKDHWTEITAALARLSAWQVVLVLALGLTYPILEGCVSYVIVRGRLPRFTLQQGLDNAWSGTFGNVVTLGAGAVPFQTWYLYRCGLPAGKGAGLMTLQYVFHKTTVLLYATVMLLFQHAWLSANTTGVLKYLPMAYAVVALVIVALVLVCVSPLVQQLAHWLLQFLPNVAGMGSIETAFLLLYSSFLPSGEVMSVLMLYRIASYYVVFAVSAAGFFIAQRHADALPPQKEE